MTPAYLSYTKAFNDNEWGRGSAIAFVLFAIILLMSALQRVILGDSDFAKMSRKDLKRDKAARAAAAEREAALVAVSRMNDQNTGGGIA